jgi:NDP-sugar pyrophosphorylase family protein
MHAILLAGGVGTRLKPYTTVIPKPLMPVGGMPIMEIILRQLARHGFKEITITLGYLGKLIEAFFGDGSQWGLKINYSWEDQPLGTMGPLKLLKNLPENFLVMNGDILSDFPFSQFYKYHVESGKNFSIGAFQKEVATDLGVLDLDSLGNLIGFREKPKLNFHVSMGIYMATREVLRYIPANRHFGFDHLVLDLISKKKAPGIFSHSGYWLDIGRREDYETSQEDFDKIKSRLLIE